MNDVLKPWQCAFDAQPKKKKEENGGSISKTACHGFYFHEVNVRRLNGNNNI